MNIYWIDMLVQFAAKSTQKTAMYFASEMDRKWRPSNKNRNSIYTRLCLRPADADMVTHGGCGEGGGGSLTHVAAVHLLQ